MALTHQLSSSLAATPSDSEITLPLVSGFRQSCAKWIPSAMEVVLLILVAISPWAFGAVHPLSEVVLYTGVGVVLILWALRLLCENRVTLSRCPVTLCLAGLFCFGVLQLVPLPGIFLDAISPATARLYAEFLPETVEKLPEGAVRNIPAQLAGSTISLYSWGTRLELLRLLAVVLVFAAVRNNLEPASALRRLAVVVVMNGTLLSFFALLQFFTSPRHVLYWTIPSQGEVFGPFICRNHFPFYVNLCIGLGFGLLLTRGVSNEDKSGRVRIDSPPSLLHDPQSLWLGCALALMVAAATLSLSRGGMVALLGATAIVLATRVAGRGFKRGLGLALVPLGAVALVVWFGLGAVEARLASLWKGAALADARVPLWCRMLPAVKDFPIFGTGYGTFPFVEALYRKSGRDPLLFVDHAHNDYLEALVEGGVARLALALLAIGFVYVLGLRAYRQQRGTPLAGLVLGGLLAFSTLAIHSFFDFGLHSPAIALLAVVMSAHLCSLSAARAIVTSEGGSLANEPFCSLRWRGSALLVMAMAVFLSFSLVHEAWRIYWADRFRLATLYLSPNDQTEQDYRILSYLRAAVAFTPEDALLQTDLADAHHNVYTVGLHLLERKNNLSSPVSFWLSAPSVAGGGGPACFGGSFLAQIAAELEATERERSWLARSHLHPSLRHYLLARDLCPLLDKPQVRLATYADLLPAGDQQGAYLRRAKRLLLGDPDLCYVCGLHELSAGSQDEAWSSWRLSLEASPKHLEEILRRAVRRLKPEEVVTKILPEQPSLLMKTAELFVQQGGTEDEARPFLEQATRLLDLRTDELKPEEWHTKAAVYERLGKLEAAVAAYEDALHRRPDAVEWRLELAKLLRHQGRPRDARRELLFILNERPGHAEAKTLYEAVARDPPESR